MIRRLFALGLVAVALASPAAAQLSFGVGGGTGIGSGVASGKHGLAFLQVKLPILPGIRADAMYYDAPEHVGRTNINVNVVMSLPTPVITPYALAGLGKYYIGEGNSTTGWNAGVGVRAKLGIGVFAELRHHDKLFRKNLVTVGLAF